MLRDYFDNINAKKGSARTRYSVKSYSVFNVLYIRTRLHGRDSGNDIGRFSVSLKLKVMTQLQQRAQINIMKIW